MGISVEISMYPLNEQYKTLIFKFIERLRAHKELEVITNNMSTRIFGDYDIVMPILQTEIKETFDDPNTIVMVLKLVNKNLEE